MIDDIVQLHGTTREDILAEVRIAAFGRIVTAELDKLRDRACHEEWSPAMSLRLIRSARARCKSSSAFSLSRSSRNSSTDSSQARRLPEPENCVTQLRANARGETATIETDEDQPSVVPCRRS
jgi:hypothetical protein